MKRVHDKTEDEMREALVRYGVPEGLHDGLLAYLFGGYLPGNFLCCVLENDLAGAVMRADHASLAGLKDLVGFINMEIPSPAHGSPERVRLWAAECEAERKATNTVSTQ